MYILIVLIAFLATIIGSISGIGGGVVIKPVMDAISGLPMSTISFLSGTTVLSMTIVSLLRNIKEPKKPRAKIVIPLSIGSVLGGILGKQVFQMVSVAAGNSNGVGMVQNIIMVLLTSMVFIYIQKKSCIKTHTIENPLVSIVLGLFLGLFSAFLGIGGGPINIMALSYFYSLDSKLSALTSLAIIFFSQTSNLITNLVSKSVPPFDVKLLTLMILAAVCGANIGRIVNKKIDNRMVDRLFQALMVIIIALSLFNAIRFGLAL